MNCSPPVFYVHGILQARILEWVAFSFSGDHPDPGIEPGNPALQADSLPSEPPEKPQYFLKRGIKADPAPESAGRWGSGCRQGWYSAPSEAPREPSIHSPAVPGRALRLPARRLSTRPRAPETLPPPALSARASSRAAKPYLQRPRSILKGAQI